MFNSNFSVVFISKMVALNSAASFPEAGLTFRQQNIFLCVLPFGVSDFLGSGLLSYFFSPLPYLLFSSVWLFLYQDLFFPRKDSSMQKSSEHIPETGPGTCPCFPPVPLRCPCCWKGSRQEDILSQGLTQIFYNPFQDRHHGVLPYLPPSPSCFTFIEFWCAFQSYVCSETLGTRFTTFCLKKKFEN